MAAKKSLPQGSNSIESPGKAWKVKLGAVGMKSIEKETSNTVELKQPLAVTTITTTGNKSGHAALGCQSPTRIPKRMINKSNVDQAGTMESGENSPKKAVLKVSQVKRVRQMQGS